MRPLLLRYGPLTMTTPRKLEGTDEATATRLVFVLHFNQPYGNLDRVFDDAMDRCYLRTLDLLLAHPQVRTGIHVSGPLLEWAERHRHELLDKLGRLVALGQAEILGGGLQEPMLAILPDRDAIGQLRAMADYCQQLFGARPQGMWLTERVWEPDLPRVITQGGYGYTLVDDSHLHAAGAEGELSGYYVTDKAGAPLAVFPIDRGLRTRIPFADIEPLVEYLIERRGRTLTYGDDAEKFGIWPTTEKRTWEEGWLEQLFEALGKRADEIQTVTPSAALRREPAQARVYIPTISYAEMGEWTLPAAAGVQYQDLGRRLRLSRLGPAAQPFMRGGIWQGFLAKYPESQLIYRKMLRVSAAVERARKRGDEEYPAARDALYCGQCNCGYWHGLFGGLYLQHLRSTLMSALLEAESLAEPRPHVAVEVTDYDGDLQDEVLIEAPELNVYVAPASGGRAFEIDLRKPRFHLTGVLGRRPESYHEDVPRARVISDDELENISAHDLVRATEEGLAERLRYDAYPRGAFVDHLLPADADAERFDRDYAPLVALPTAAYAIASLESSAASASLELRWEAEGFHLEKRLGVGQKLGVAAEYRLGYEGERRQLCFASEIDFSLLTPRAEAGRSLVVLSPDGAPLNRPAEAAPGAQAVHPQVGGVRLLVEPLGIDLAIRCRPAAELWRIPIETVSQSERGFEPSYQGTALVFVWRAEVGAGKRLEAALELSQSGPH